jgi:hypothetical protein
MAEHNKNITIEGVRTAGAPVFHASFFELTTAQGGIILDVGSVDDQQLTKALSNPIDTDEVIKAYVSHRFGMSVESLLELQRRVNAAVTELER